MEKKENTFRIVQIVDQSTFIINAGTNQGIKEDDKFIILGNKTNAILDPKTDKVIEELPTKKATIHAKSVYNNTSICKTEWIDAYHSNGLASGISGIALHETLSAALAGYDVPGHYKEINIREDESKPLDDHDDSPVKINDQVKKIGSTEQSQS